MDKPSIKEIAEHMNSQEEALLFYSYYESQGWKVGRNKMKSWKSAASGWLTRNKQRNQPSKIDTVLASSNSTISDRIWKRMKQSFGENKFIREYGELPTKPWIDMIESLSNQQIAHGLTEMAKLGKDWPPSAGGFRKLCVSYRPPFKALKHFPSYKEKLQQRKAVEHIRIKSMNVIRSIL